MTLAVAQGVPMISGGDEMGRSQNGNNNAYCHDSPLTWTPWDVPPTERQFLDFARRLLRIRRNNAAFRRPHFLSSGGPNGMSARWVRPDGGDMTDIDWADPNRRVLGLLLHQQPEADVLVYLNASAADVDVVLPTPRLHSQWTVLLDTFDAAGPAESGPGYLLRAHSAAILRAGNASFP